MNKLYKKEEEAILNKKKKREESKQKNKFEKAKNNNRNGINQYNCYQGYYISQMPPINNQNPIPMVDYQNFLYYNQIYTQMCGFPPFFQQYMIEPPKTLEENINGIYQRGIVNNIIGAFFIKEHQEKMKNNEKRKVPISMVEFTDDQDNNNNNDITNNNNASTMINNCINGCFQRNDVTYSPNDKNNNDNYTDNKGDNINNNINNKIKKDNMNENRKNIIDDKNEKEIESNSDNHHENNHLKKPDLVF